MALLPEFAAMSAEEIRILAQPLVGDPAPLDWTGRIGRVVLIVRAHVGPERVRMADEGGLWIGLENRIEGFCKPRAPGTFIRKVIHLLEVNQDRHAELGGQRVDAAQLQGRRRRRETSASPKPCAPSFTAWVRTCSARGLRHVVAVEPGEAARRSGLKRLHLLEDNPAREQIRLRHACAIEMHEVARHLLTKMEVKIEHGRAPLVCGRPLATQRRHNHGLTTRARRNLNGGIHVDSSCDSNRQLFLTQRVLGSARAEALGACRACETCSLSAGPRPVPFARSACVQITGFQSGSRIR